MLSNNLLARDAQAVDERSYVSQQKVCLGLELDIVGEGFDVFFDCLDPLA